MCLKLHGNAIILKNVVVYLFVLKKHANIRRTPPFVHGIRLGRMLIHLSVYFKSVFNIHNSSEVSK